MLQQNVVPISKRSTARSRVLSSLCCCIFSCNGLCLVLRCPLLLPQVLLHLGSRAGAISGAGAAPALSLVCGHWLDRPQQRQELN